MVEQRAIENSMFADSLLDSRGQRSRRSWTTLTSFGLEAIIIGLLLLLPLLQTVVLPSARSVSTPVTLGQPAAQPAAPRQRSGGVPVAPSAFIFTRLLHPSYSPRPSVDPTVDGTDQPPCVSACGVGSLGDNHSILDRLAVSSGSAPVMPARPVSPGRAIRSSTLLEGNLIRRVQPVYPPLARNVRVQGAVVLSAVISKGGAIENLQVLSGHPLLIPAAIEAVKQWRYRPYVLNNEPVEVETQITLNFTLGGN